MSEIHKLWIACEPSSKPLATKQRVTNCKEVEGSRELELTLMGSVFSWLLEFQC